MQDRTVPAKKAISLCIGSVLAATLAVVPPVGAQALSKVDRLLQQDGFQIRASIDPSNPFHYSYHDINGTTYPGFIQANYTAPDWQQSPRFTDWDGMALNGPWGVWNVDLNATGNNKFPDQVPADVPHLPQLVSMAIMDEVPWESNLSVYANVISQFQYAHSQSAYDNTILSTNNFKGQLQLDGVGVSNFIQAAHPDMLTFDWYPYNTGNAAAGNDSQILNTPFDSWYTEMRFYRDVTLDNSYQSSNPNYSVAWGVWRQTYATTGDGTRTPSATEYAEQTFTAMAFGAKSMSDFLYNDGASTLFEHGDGTPTTPFYYVVQRVNQEVKNLGPAMVRLTPLIANPNLDWSAGTPDILFLRGQDLTGNPSAPTTPTALPNGFQPNPVNGNSFSTWNPGANDPWMSGFGQVNIGGKFGQYINPRNGNTAYTTGDALVSWFRPIGEDQATATADGDIYFMIVNAFSTPTADPSDCLQNIHLQFSTWPLAPGATDPSIQYLDPTTGQVMTLNLDSSLHVTNSSIYPAGSYFLTMNGSKLQLNVYLNGGEPFLFKFNTGAPFAVPEPASAAAILGLGGLAMLRRRRVNSNKSF